VTLLFLRPMDSRSTLMPNDVPRAVFVLLNSPLNAPREYGDLNYNQCNFTCSGWVVPFMGVNTCIMNCFIGESVFIFKIIFFGEGLVKQMIPIMSHVMFYNGHNLIINITYLVRILACAERATSLANSRHILINNGIFFFVMMWWF